MLFMRMWFRARKRPLQTLFTNMIMGLSSVYLAFMARRRKYIFPLTEPAKQWCVNHI
jgi:hypothetical protein